PESGDMTMMSAGLTGSLTTSAHPAPRRNGSQTDGTAAVPAVATAATIKIAAHLNRGETMLKFMSLVRGNVPDPNLRSLCAVFCFLHGRGSEKGRYARVVDAIRLWQFFTLVSGELVVRSALCHSANVGYLGDPRRHGAARGAGAGGGDPCLYGHSTIPV